MGDQAGEQMTKLITAEEFEANCLELIDLVEEKGFTYVITKDGKPFVMMIPAPPAEDTPGTSCVNDTIR
jgi:antitoxin (DNA-binding transcriptional repressor) of toxin-antitoxin stability system